MAAEAMVVEQHIYTRDEVERLLWFHFGRRPQLTTHGRTIARYSRGPYICPRCMNVPEQRAQCTFCERTGKVNDAMPIGSSTVSVSDMLLSRADLMCALKELDLMHRALLLYWFSGEYTVNSIAHLMRQYNGGVTPSTRTLFRWRARAIDYLVAAINRTYARSKG